MKALYRSVQLLLFPPLFFLLTSQSATAKVTAITSKKRFDQKMEQGNPMIVKFYADWCGVCDTVKEAFKEISEDPTFNTIDFIEIDIDKNGPIADQFNVAGIPTFLYLQNDNVVNQEVGVSDIARFKENMGNSIRNSFSKTAPLPKQAEIIIEQEPTTEISKIVVEKENIVPTGSSGFIDQIKAFILWLINALKEVVGTIVNMIKSLFGR